MEFQARVLYDFEAVGEGELTVRTGDVVTVTSTTVGEGWWMGRAVDGREGILPQTYVERMESTATSLPLENREQGREAKKVSAFTSSCLSTASPFRCKV